MPTRPGIERSGRSTRSSSLHSRVWRCPPHCGARHELASWRTRQPAFWSVRSSSTSTAISTRARALRSSPRPSQCSSPAHEKQHATRCEHMTRYSSRAPSRSASSTRAVATSPASIPSRGALPAVRASCWCQKHYDQSARIAAPFSNRGSDPSTNRPSNVQLSRSLKRRLFSREGYGEGVSGRSASSAIASRNACSKDLGWKSNRSIPDRSVTVVSVESPSINGLATPASTGVMSPIQ